jgi:hypothetical protein
MKKILIEDWYAPEFKVTVKGSQKCPNATLRRRSSFAPLFRAIQCEPGFAAPCGFRRIAHFAGALVHHTF